MAPFTSYYCYCTLVGLQEDRRCWCWLTFRLPDYPTTRLPDYPTTYLSGQSSSSSLDSEDDYRSGSRNFRATQTTDFLETTLTRTITTNILFTWVKPFSIIIIPVEAVNLFSICNSDYDDHLHQHCSNNRPGRLFQISCSRVARTRVRQWRHKHKHKDQTSSFLMLILMSPPSCCSLVLMLMLMPAYVASENQP